MNGQHIKGAKERGNYYESLFKTACLQRGLSVSPPEGDCMGYDVVVDGPSGLRKVQIKGTACKTNARSYTVSLHTGRNRRGWYSMTAWDFLALYADVPDVRCWYVIPRENLKRKASAKVYPHIPNSRGQFEPFKNAFHLL